MAVRWKQVMTMLLKGVSQSGTARAEYLLVLGPLLLSWEVDRAFGGLLWFRAGVIAVRGHRLLGSFHRAGQVW